jgi:hypothetical protein
MHFSKLATFVGNYCQAKFCYYTVKHEKELVIMAHADQIYQSFIALWAFLDLEFLFKFPKQIRLLLIAIEVRFKDDNLPAQCKIVFAVDANKKIINNPLMKSCLAGMNVLTATYPNICEHLLFEKYGKDRHYEILNISFKYVLKEMIIYLIACNFY